MSIRVQLPKVKKEYMNNSKVANFISSNTELLDKTIQLKTIPKKNVFVTVDLTADEKVSLTNHNITPYDMAVMDSVYTLLANEVTSFSPEMVVRIMSGNFEQKITQHKLDEVNNSMRKLSMIRISIDCTDELVTRKKVKKGSRVALTSYLMPVREIKVDSGNNQATMNGYQLIEKPVLYIYAESVKQIVSVPTSLLEVNGYDTDDMMIIKRALIKRIEMMKNDKNNISSNIIIYERYDKSTGKKTGFFSSLGFAETDYSNWKKKKNNLHHIIKNILDGFVVEKYINGYEMVKEGKQKIIGVSIIF